MAMIKSITEVGCDAGSIIHLIHLHELNCLDLLTDFKRIIVFGTVWEEIRASF